MREVFTIAIDAGCGKPGALTSEQPKNKLHGFSTGPVVVFAFRSVLNGTGEVLESGYSGIYPVFWCCRSGLN
jgi:hypothetical protein